jgi:nucleoside 2-deoxyribosyltransferase
VPKSPNLTVFVSSTSTDLEDYRAVARNTILDMNWRPVMMEHFVAQPDKTVESCCKAIDGSDLMLLIVAWRQGWVPTTEMGGNGQDSITAFELSHARDRKIPVLVLMATDQWPGNLWEDDASRRQWVKRFREELNQVATFYEFELSGNRESERLPRFRALAKQTLLAHKERLLETGENNNVSALDFFQSARDGLLEGKDIPVVGSGMYGAGSLSSEALVKAMLQRSDVPGAFSKEGSSLATAAEYRERFDGSREQFLRRFRNILDQQRGEIQTPPVLDLLSGIERLPLIVSATYDNMLEEALARAGRPYVTVAHVLRSFNGERDGSILVQRPGVKASFCRADQLQLVPEECVVYKPQGSPFLHDGLDPDWEIDTVVATETDHVMFLQRLESPETGVPLPVRSRFRRSALLFIGYAMDVWQYRLMMLVFQSARRQDGRASTRAVRVPDTEVEEVAWNRLNADLIRMDPNEFARSAMRVRKAAE